MRIAAVAALLLLALTGCAAGASAAPAPPVGHAELQLIGDWTGSADEDGVVAMTVATADDDGSTFDGELTFRAADTVQTEPVHAAMTPNGHLVAEIGDDASIEVHIVDPTTLDYCFIRYGTEPVQACGRLVRGD
jgi:hypothetical protein